MDESDGEDELSITEKLRRASAESPANIPMLVVVSFNPDAKGLQKKQIEIQRGKFLVLDERSLKTHHISMDQVILSTRNLFSTNGYSSKQQIMKKDLFHTYAVGPCYDVNL